MLILMRALKVVGLASAALVLGISLVAARFWWATLTPRVPRGWPAGSVWIAAPPSPLDWSPRGDFVGCWFNAQRNVDRCQFANYQGTISHVGDYTTCDDRSALPDSQLRIRAANYAKGTFDESTVYEVKLQNGMILIPVCTCEARKNTPKPNKSEPNAK